MAKIKGAVLLATLILGSTPGMPESDPSLGSQAEHQKLTDPGNISQVEKREETSVEIEPRGLRQVERPASPSVQQNPPLKLQPMAPQQGLPLTVAPPILMPLIRQSEAEQFEMPLPCMGLRPGRCWLSRPGTGSTEEALAYYRRIGAIRLSSLYELNSGSLVQDTLDAFKSRNGFLDVNNQPQAHTRTTYFNNIDLRVGRDMHCRQTGERVACYVSNYGPAPFINGSRNPAFPNSQLALHEAVNRGKPLATVAMEFAPDPPPMTAVVEENKQEVDTGIMIESGDIVEFSATGTIWAGVLLTGTNGPKGWNAPTFDSKFPLTGVPPFSLIGQIRSLNSLYYSNWSNGYSDDRAWFYIGETSTYAYPNDANPLKERYGRKSGETRIAHGSNGQLFLRTNDDTPGNGSGAFQVRIQIRRNVKFYVYDQNGNLLPLVALDGEGHKFVPHVCLACHGGQYNAADHGVYGSSFLPFDVFNFLYHDSPGFRLADQQDQFRELNRLVKRTNPSGQNPHRPISTMVDVMYHGQVEQSGAAPTPPVPPGWRGHEDLYLGFVGRFCRLCHMAQKEGIDFESYDNFKSKALSVAYDLCQGGTMPHAQGPYDHLVADRFSEKVGGEMRALGINCIKPKFP